MSLIYRRPWTSQPRGVAAINLAHPLAQGLVGFWTPIGGRLVDVLDYSTPSANTATAAMSAKGHTTLYNNTKTTYAHRSRYDVLGDITIAAEVDVVSLTGYGAILQKNSSDSTTLPYEFRLGKSTTTSDFVFVRGNSAFARFEGAEGDQISAGQTAFVAVTQDGSSIGTTPVFYVNGKTVASGAKIGTGTGAATTNSGSLYLGSRFDSVTYSNYAALYVALWARSLSRSEIASFRANPWQIFAPLPRRIWAPSGGATNPTPGAAALAITGHAPTVAQTWSAAPGLSALTFTGHAPTVQLTSSAAPGVGALSIIGHAPTVAQTWSASPSTGALSLTGYAPTIAQTWSAAPQVGAITITGHAPTATVSAAGTVSVDVGLLAFTGYAPTIAQTWSAAPSAGALTITGYAPTITTTAGIATGLGALTLTGHAPTVAQTWSASPQAGQIVITGYAPTITQGGSFTAVAGAGQIVITGYAPTVTTASELAGSPPGLNFDADEDEYIEDMQMLMAIAAAAFELEMV